MATDALAARTRDELLDRVTDFVGHKGERRGLKFQLPIAPAEKVFDLAQTTVRTYQDVLEFLLGDGLEVYVAALVSDELCSSRLEGGACRWSSPERA